MSTPTTQKYIQQNISDLRSHFSYQDDDELIIRKEACQINLKKSATKKSTTEKSDCATQWGGKLKGKTFKN